MPRQTSRSFHRIIAKYDPTGEYDRILVRKDAFKDAGKVNMSVDLSVVSEEDDSFMKIDKADVDMDVAAASARMAANKRSRVRGRRYTTHLTH